MEPAFLTEEKAGGGWGRVAALLFPAACVNCAGSVGSAALGALCGPCWKGVAWLDEGRGRRVGAAWQFDTLRAAGAFDGALREAIHSYKFGGKTAFRRPFVGLLASLPMQADLLCWPPTAASSLKERGFDSTAELAMGLAKKIRLPVFRGLRRVRQGEKQASLGRQERWANAKGAFAAEGDGITGRRVLLVDDVVTTGATLSECAGALKRGGALEVACIALASGELRGN